ncbi:hypothetical protein EDB83DRAFT_2234057 [Lactarius deliciosus]|nr:hypothetical protein EDB83DRAFT_2234057 [Lactarius deliciosus]
MAKEDTECVNTLFVELPKLRDWQEAYKDGPVELDLNPQELVDWTEGVEHLKTKTEDELYGMLGFEDRKIPFLVTEVDTESDFYMSAQTGTYEGDVFAPAMEPRATRRPFSLKWHQLVRVTKMVERALTSGPIMLMDDFGVGKMVQVLAFFAVMAYYRKFYSEAKQYPGIWEWTNFTGEKATLPKSPFLIVVPPALVDQVAWECDHFLEKGSFDVIRYFGRYKTNQKVWEELRKPSSTGNPSHMRIYVASTTVSMCG